MQKILYYILISLLFVNVNVYATGGKLIGSSIKTCNGIMYGKHGSDVHWHIAEKKDSGYYPVGDAIYNDPCGSTTVKTTKTTTKKQTTKTTATVSTTTQNTTKVQTTTKNISTTSKNITSKVSSSVNAEEKNKETITKIIKSDDNSIKKIIIDNEIVEVKDIINYKTVKENVEIDVVPTDEKATYKIEQKSKLDMGQNEVVVEVKAEDESLKKYIINIIREEIFNSNKNIIVFINDEEVMFDNFESRVSVDYKDLKINFDYILEDKKSKVEVEEIKELKIGDNKLKFKVIAEDNSEQLYVVTIYRPSKTEDLVLTILAGVIIGGFCYGIYYLLKKGKQIIKRISK